MADGDSIYIAHSPAEVHELATGGQLVLVTQSAWKAGAWRRDLYLLNLDHVAGVELLHLPEDPQEAGLGFVLREAI